MLLELIFIVLLRNVTDTRHTHARTTLPLLGLLVGAKNLPELEIIKHVRNTGIYKIS